MNNHRAPWRGEHPPKARQIIDDHRINDGNSRVGLHLNQTQLGSVGIFRHKLCVKPQQRAIPIGTAPILQNRRILNPKKVRCQAAPQSLRRYRYTNKKPVTQPALTTPSRRQTTSFNPYR